MKDLVDLYSPNWKRAFNRLQWHIKPLVVLLYLISAAYVLAMVYVLALTVIYFAETLYETSRVLTFITVVVIGLWFHLRKYYK